MRRQGLGAQQLTKLLQTHTGMSTQGTFRNGSEGKGVWPWDFSFFGEDLQGWAALRGWVDGGMPVTPASRSAARAGWFPPHLCAVLRADTIWSPPLTVATTSQTRDTQGRWRAEGGRGKRDREVMEERKRMQTEEEAGRAESRERIPSGTQNWFFSPNFSKVLFSL